MGEPAAKKAKTGEAPTGLTADHPRVVCRARFPGKEDVPKELHYFYLRALGEVPRMLLEVSETPYDSVMYFGKGEFKAIAPFGQMPLYKGPELGGMVLAQSGSICRHIAGEVGLLGASPKERALQDMVFELGKEIIDGKSGFFEKELPERYRTKVDKAQELLGKTEGPYFSGKSLGYGDVSVFHALHTLEEVKPGCLAAWPKLADFRSAVAAVPAMAAYLASARRVPITPNEKGDKPHAGMPGYTFTTPLKPESYAETFD